MDMWLILSLFVSLPFGLSGETTCYNCVSRSKVRNKDSTCENPEKMLVPIPCKDYCYKIEFIDGETNDYIIQRGCNFNEETRVCLPEGRPEAIEDTCADIPSTSTRLNCNGTCCTGDACNTASTSFVSSVVTCLLPLLLVLLLTKFL